MYDTRNAGGGRFYGTRGVAAEMSRMSGRAVSHKIVRCICEKVWWDKSGQIQAAKARWTRIRADCPNDVWETDIVHVRF